MVGVDFKMESPSFWSLLGMRYLLPITHNPDPEMMGIVATVWRNNAVKNQCRQKFNVVLLKQE